MTGPAGPVFRTGLVRGRPPRMTIHTGTNPMQR